VEGAPDFQLEPLAEPPAPAGWRCPRCAYAAAATDRHCPRCFASPESTLGAGEAAVRRRPDLPEHASTGTLFWIFGLLLATNVGLAWALSDLPDETPWAESTVRRAATALTVVAALDTLRDLIAYLRLRGSIVAPPGPTQKARTTWLLALPVLALVLAVNLSYHWSLLALAGVEPETDALLASGHHTAWLLFLICVQPAVIEELFFRRLAFDFFLQHTGAGTAAFASAAMFAAAHTGALLSFPMLLGFGMVMAWLRWRTGSLVLPILMHFLHNLAISIHDLASA
jgi:membrane protease YdiL (CAAX protease family)